MKQKDKFKLIKISYKPPAFNQLTFKYGTWAGARPRLGQQKGTRVIITSTHHCKKKWKNGLCFPTDHLLFPVL